MADSRWGRTGGNAALHKFICPKFKKISHDEVFQEGFDSEIEIQGRGQIIHTDDGFLCINQKLFDVISSNNLPGLTFKPVGKRGWNVLNIRNRVNVRPDVFTSIRGDCEVCGRAREVIGYPHHLGQIETLPEAECFFSTVKDQECTGWLDRNLLLTSGVLNILRENGFRGGYFRLLCTEAFFAQLQAAWQRGERVRQPKEAKIIL